MKKLFLLFATAVMAVSVMAEGHMKFKGVEMTGTPKSFVKQLVAKGFSYMGEVDGTDVLIGNFAGYKDCKVFVLSKDNEVIRVNVAFQDYDNWSALYGNYTALKDLLTTKYGQPAIDKEEWQSRIEPSDDNSKMHELRMDRATFFSEFDTAEGVIQLQILKLNYSMCVVCISYFDNQSQARLKNEALDDL